jgi:solute carrier family 35 protein F1/2
MKISGVVICIVGVVMVVFSDVHAGDRAGGSNPVKGDFLVIAGATLYAVSNVTEEFLVKNADVTELMAFLGLFGAIIAAIQMYPSNNKAIIFLFILNFYEHFP